MLEKIRRYVISIIIKNKKAKTKTTNHQQQQLFVLFII